MWRIAIKSLFSRRRHPMDEASAFAIVAMSGARRRSIEDRYDLKRYALDRAPMVQIATLFLLDLFQRIQDAAPDWLHRVPNAPRVLDVGAKDFESAPALHAFFKSPLLTGVEIDAAWQAAARANLARVPGAHRFLTTDVLDHHERYDVIVWLHPFLDAPRLLEWGLPFSAFKPEVMLEHVLTLLEPHGLLMIVNQAHDEDEAQRQLLAAHALETKSFALELYFRERPDPAWVHLVRRVDSASCARS